jgi:hypothetical protein
MKLLRSRILASAYMQGLQAQVPPVTDEEVQKYYDAHVDQYDQVKVIRLSIPFAAPNETGRHLDPLAVKAEMDELRARALAGENFAELQKQAYQDLHIQATPPPMIETPLRRGGVQGDELKVFDLKAGEISPVLNLPASLAIMKVQSRDTTLIEPVRKDIASMLRRDRIQAALAKAGKSITTQFNTDYLNLPSQPDLFGPKADAFGPKADAAAETTTTGRIAVSTQQ